MSFAQPPWLWALLLLPLLAAIEAWTTRRDRARTARLVARPLWPRVVRTPPESWRFARLALLLMGAAGIVLALARPQWGTIREKIEREGADVVLVLDTSGSMATEDVPPNRFFLAKTALMNLVQRLEGERFALVAFEGDAYPLVPLTLDADAIGLFLETLEPGEVPSPGTSLAAGLAKGLALFVDQERRNKVLVLVSDGEDLEGDVAAAVQRSKDAGVVVHAVGVGTRQGQPVPDFDREGNRAGYKKNEDGSVAVSRANPETLESIARGTGGRVFFLSPTDLSLAPLAATIEGMEERAVATEYSYPKKERFQVPLGVGLTALTLALLLPPPLRRRRDAARRAAAAGVMLLLGTARARADSPVADELLLRPTRLTAEGRKQYAEGNHPKALEAFERAAKARPGDARARFNLADALYKNGKFDEAEAHYKALAGDARSPLVAASRYNLGNALFEKRDYAGAVGAYRDALRLQPGDADTQHNLELALRALREQQQQQKKEPQDKQPQQNPEKQQPNANGQRQDRPKSQAEQERERYEKETGMPKERAMQLLEALQQNEKAEHKKQRAAKRKDQGKGKDW